MEDWLEKRYDGCMNGIEWTISNSIQKDWMEYSKTKAYREIADAVHDLISGKAFEEYVDEQY